MPQANRILLLDDGELSNVARILNALGLEHTRIRGQQVVGKLSPPSELLITTSRCAQLVRRGSPPEASSGRPVRIIGVHENSSAMRRMLHRMGYDLLVGLPGKDEVWQPLIHRATYRGKERRCGARIIVGSPVALSTSGSEPAVLAATLMEISNRSCRLLASSKLKTGSELELTLPETTTASRPLTLAGRVIRSGSGPSPDCQSVTLIFDHPMSSETRTELNGVVNLWSVGPPADASDGSGSKSSLEAPHSSRVPMTAPTTVPVDVDPGAATSVRVPVEIADSQGSE